MSQIDGGLDFNYPARNKILYQEQTKVGYVDGDSTTRTEKPAPSCSTYFTAGMTPEGKARLRCMRGWLWKECKRTLGEYKSWRYKYTVEGTITFHGRIQPIDRENPEETAQGAQTSQYQTQVIEMP
ncbi:hypothetical protein CABS01_06735 [Colletotrichum abscissum]|uniref:Uncharacterized protein n=1 Tax=Colletotrichum abscissum TaxID=1671311 RepID=A0A9P9X6H9_9PEZI|nr:uncharacterized protein CABS01_06735 [Colletotrichum abscissum]KAI3537343.1 hypothetical protein CABS02_12167 [Colletotrichum abscissum]KAK1514756.1 hypothetical protein CABS01_06735 [Colletotrichum abscissum]